MRRALYVPVLLIALAALFGLGGCGEDDTTTSTAPDSTSASAPAATTTSGPQQGTSDADAGGTTQPTTAGAAQPGAGTSVVIDTTLGAMTLELDAETAPLTVENFLSYVQSGFYDGTIFHRVIPGFMIQGGGFTEDLQEKPTEPPVKNEAANGLKNLRGTIAMARTAEVDSATSQFFINVADNPALDHQDESQPGFGYAVFGRVTEGMEVADKIVAVPTGTEGPFQDVPQTPVVIRSITVGEGS